MDQSNKKGKIFVITASLIAILIAIGAIVFFLVRNGKGPEASTDEQIKELFDDESFKSKSRSEQVEDVGEVLRRLEEKGDISDIKLDENCEDRYTFKYEDGTLGGVCLAPLGYVKEKESPADTESVKPEETGISFDFDKSDDTEKAEGTDEDGGEKRNGADAAPDKAPVKYGTRDAKGSDGISVLILNGFENSSFRRDYYDDLCREWLEAGYDVDVDVDCSIDDLRDLSGYDAVVFSMHGSHYKDEPVLVLNEKVTDETDEEYSNELSVNNTVAKVFCSDGEQHYWVRPSFFEEADGNGSFNGAVVFSESCCFFGCDCISKTPDVMLAKGFLAGGASVCIGYHNSVGAEYSRDVMKITLERMFEGYSAKEALDVAMNVFGEDDDWEDRNADKYIAYPVVYKNGGAVIEAVGGKKTGDEIYQPVIDEYTDLVKKLHGDDAQSFVKSVGSEYDYVTQSAAEAALYYWNFGAEEVNNGDYPVPQRQCLKYFYAFRDINGDGTEEFIMAYGPNSEYTEPRGTEGYGGYSICDVFTSCGGKIVKLSNTDDGFPLAHAWILTDGTVETLGEGGSLLRYTLPVGNDALVLKQKLFSKDDKTYYEYADGKVEAADGKEWTDIFYSPLDDLVEFDWRFIEDGYTKELCENALEGDRQFWLDFIENGKYVGFVKDTFADRTEEDAKDLVWEYSIDELTDAPASQLFIRVGEGASGFGTNFLFCRSGDDATLASNIYGYGYPKWYEPESLVAVPPSFKPFGGEDNLTAEIRFYALYAGTLYEHSALIAGDGKYTRQTYQDTESIDKEEFRSYSENMTDFEWTKFETALKFEKKEPKITEYAMSDFIGMTFADLAKLAGEDYTVADEGMEGTYPAYFKSRIVPYVFGFYSPDGDHYKPLPTDKIGFVECAWSGADLPVIGTKITTASSLDKIKEYTKVDPEVSMMDDSYYIVYEEGGISYMFIWNSKPASGDHPDDVLVSKMP